MINLFSNWAEQIIIAVVITSIIEMLLPDNKNKKYIKIVMGIYILFSIIFPIIDKKDLLSFDTINLESYVIDDNIIKSEGVNQESMDERIQQLYVEELENNIKIKVEQEGYDVKSCKVDATLYGDENKQGINKIVLVISSDSNVSNNANIKVVNKIDINVGLDKYFRNTEGDDKSKISSSEVAYLKELLSTYYEIDNNKISISTK